MLELLVAGVLTVHLLAMNVACGGPLLCLGLRRYELNQERSQRSLGQSLAWLSLGAFLVGMLTGGGLLVLPGAEGLRGALGRFPARAYWFAGAELLFSLICLWAYAQFWGRPRPWRWGHGLLAWAATGNLLYHFPPLMIVIGKLTKNPAWTVEAVIDRPLFLELMVHPEVLSLSLHYGAASLAVAAMGVLALVARQESEEKETNACRGAARIALFCTLLQLPLGVWVLVTLPEAGRGALVGGSVLASALFLGSLITTMVLMQGLMRIAIGDFAKQDCLRVVWLMVLIVLLMTATLRMSRHQLHRSAASDAAYEPITAGGQRFI